MKIKTSELTGIALDWAVAECEGGKRLHSTELRFGLFVPVKVVPKYSTNWTHAGPIIEREGISIAQDGNKEWRSGPSLLPMCHYGPTPLIAAMRCYVASKLGNEVDVPDELVSSSRNEVQATPEWGVGCE